MIDIAHSDAVSGSMMVTQSRTSWGIEVGRHRFCVTRTREARILGGLNDRGHPRPAGKRAWPLTIGAFASVSAFGLFVVGAIASEPRPQSRYSLSLPVPIRTAKVAKDRGVSRLRTVAAHREAPARVDDLSGPRFDAADEPYVIRAMRAGEFQEWLGADGQRRFLNAGPERAEGGRHCRDLALLIRSPDGSSQTRTARRCASGASGRAIVDTAATISHAPVVSDMADASSPDLVAGFAGNPSRIDAEEEKEKIASD